VEDRKELKYSVQDIDDKVRSFKDMNSIIGRCFGEMLNTWTKDDRGLIYCLQREWAEDLSKYINEQLKVKICGVYHAKMDSKERREILKEWKEGRTKIIVAMSALAAGLDYTAVRMVVHQGFAQNLIEFCQETGRAGRDGKPAECVVFFWSGIEKETDWIEDEGRKDMLKWIRTKGCRKVAMSQYVHGVGWNCVGQEDGRLCDNCERMLEDESGWKNEAKVGRKRQREGEEKEVGLAVGIKGMVKDLRGKCPVCWVDKKKAAENHGLFKCQYGLEDIKLTCDRNMTGLCFKCQGNHRRESCEVVLYKDGTCCFSCGLPQRVYGEVIHGNRETGGCEDGLYHLMRGVCWRVYRTPELKRKYLMSVWREVESEMKFKEWLTRSDGSGEILNGCRLMFNVWKERQ